MRQMLDLQIQLATARTAHDKAVLTRQIEATDRHIDQLVYALYELTYDDICIAEQTSS